MAMVFNPLTGRMEDDGQPPESIVGAPPLIDPNAPPDLPPIAGAGPVEKGGGGSGLPPPPPPPSAPAVPALPSVASVFPAKPLHEDSHTTEGRHETVKDVLAQGNLQVAQDEATDASKDVGAVNQKEAGVQSTAANARLTEVADRNRKLAEMEVKRQQVVKDNIAQDNREIEEAKQAKIEAGGAREHYWDGRTGAHIFAALLQGVGEAANAFQGRSGPSPASQIINSKIDDHVKTVTAKWEATEAARKLHKENRTAYETELDRQKIAAINQSLLSLDLIDEQLKAGIAGLGPEKAAAAQKLYDADKNEARKRLELERAGLYDKSTKDTSVSRTESGAGTGAQAVQQSEKWVPDPKTGQPILAPNVSVAETTKARDGYAALDGLRDLKGRMQAFIKDHNGVVPKNWDPDTRNAYGALATEAAGYLTKLNESGVLNEGEFHRYSAIFAPGGLEELLSSKAGIENGLNEVVTGAEARYVGRVKSLVPTYGREPKTDSGTSSSSAPRAAPAPSPRASVPGAGELAQMVAGRNDQQLAQILSNPNTPKEVKQAVTNELASRGKKPN